jgi:glycine/D-amino acid oxidase-like deaminating enzyme
VTVAGRLTIIGGGVMGLMTAYYAAPLADAVTVLERSRVGDPDLVADDEFILGAVPGAEDVFTGVGWRGTGYKFAPWVGKVLAQFAVQRGTVYDIGRFTPARFAGSVPVKGIAS